VRAPTKPFSYYIHLMTLPFPCFLTLVYTSPIEKRPRKFPTASKNAILTVFLSSARNLLELSRKFLVDLQAKRENWTENSTIGDLFVEFGPLFKLYGAYAMNHELAVEVIRSLIENEVDKGVYARHFTEGMSNPRTRNASVEDYLIRPIQRVPRYKLLLEGLIKCTEPSHPDYDLLIEGLDTISDAASHINESIRRRENKEKLREIEKQFTSTVILVDPTKPDRRLIKEGYLLRQTRAKETSYYFHLLNDLLLYSDSNVNGYNLHRRLDLSDARISEESGEDGIKKLACLFSEKSFVVQMKDDAEYEEWKAAFAQSSARCSWMQDAESAADAAYAPVWEQDHKSDTCRLCEAQFTFFSRRHHCRRCGGLVCGKCSNYTAVLPHISKTKQLRVCKNCYTTIQLKGTDDLRTSSTGLPGSNATTSPGPLGPTSPNVVTPVPAPTILLKKDITLISFLELTLGSTHPNFQLYLTYLVDNGIVPQNLGQLDAKRLVEMGFVQQDAETIERTLRGGTAPQPQPSQPLPAPAPATPAKPPALPSTLPPLPSLPPLPATPASPSSSAAPPVPVPPLPVPPSTPAGQPPGPGDEQPKRPPLPAKRGSTVAMTLAAASAAAAAFVASQGQREAQATDETISSSATESASPSASGTLPLWVESPTRDPSTGGTRWVNTISLEQATVLTPAMKAATVQQSAAVAALAKKDPLFAIAAQLLESERKFVQLLETLSTALAVPILTDLRPKGSGATQTLALSGVSVPPRVIVFFANVEPILTLAKHLHASASAALEVQTSDLLAGAMPIPKLTRFCSVMEQCTHLLGIYTPFAEALYTAFSCLIEKSNSAESVVPLIFKSKALRSQAQLTEALSILPALMRAPLCRLDDYVSYFSKFLQVLREALPSFVYGVVAATPIRAVLPEELLVEPQGLANSLAMSGDANLATSAGVGVDVTTRSGIDELKRLATKVLIELCKSRVVVRHAFVQGMNSYKLEQIETQFSPPLELRIPGRELLKHATITRVTRRGPVKYVFHLFNDQLIYSEPSAVAGFKLRLHRRFDLSTLSVSQPFGGQGTTPGFSVLSPQKSFVLEFPTVKERDEWLTAIEQAVAAVKRVLANGLTASSKSDIEGGLLDGYLLGDAAVAAVLTGAEEDGDDEAKSAAAESTAPVWVMDAVRDDCSLCNAKFTFWNRRHHCRQCGCLVCNRCSQGRVLLVNIDRNSPVRVCDKCISTSNATKTATAAGATQTPEPPQSPGGNPLAQESTSPEAKAQPEPTSSPQSAPLPTAAHSSPSTHTPPAPLPQAPSPTRQTPQGGVPLPVPVLPSLPTKPSRPVPAAPQQITSAITPLEVPTDASSASDETPKRVLPSVPTPTAKPPVLPQPPPLPPKANLSHQPPPPPPKAGASAETIVSNVVSAPKPTIVLPASAHPPYASPSEGGSRQLPAVPQEPRVPPMPSPFLPAGARLTNSTPLPPTPPAPPPPFTPQGAPTRSLPAAVDDNCNPLVPIPARPILNSDPMLGRTIHDSGATCDIAEVAPQHEGERAREEQDPLNTLPPTPSGQRPLIAQPLPSPPLPGSRIAGPPTPLTPLTTLPHPPTPLPPQPPSRPVLPPTPSQHAPSVAGNAPEGGASRMPPLPSPVIPTQATVPMVLPTPPVTNRNLPELPPVPKQ